MDNVNYFTDLFESIPDFNKIVLLMFLIKTMLFFYMNVAFQKVIITFHKKNIKIFYLN